MQFGSDLSSCPNKAGRVRVIIRVRLENMGPGIPENDKHPNIRTNLGIDMINAHYSHKI